MTCGAAAVLQVVNLKSHAAEADHNDDDDDDDVHWSDQPSSVLIADVQQTKAE